MDAEQLSQRRMSCHHTGYHEQRHSEDEHWKFGRAGQGSVLNKALIAQRMHIDARHGRGMRSRKQVSQFECRGTDDDAAASDQFGIKPIV